MMGTESLMVYECDTCVDTWIIYVDDGFDDEDVGVHGNGGHGDDDDDDDNDDDDDEAIFIQTGWFIS